MAWSPCEIEIVAGPHKGTRFGVTGSQVTLGRERQNMVALPDDATVSGVHAILEWQVDRWVLIDASSKNGIYLLRGAERHKVLSPQAMPLGQIFYLGSTGLRLVAADAPSDSSSPQTERSPQPGVHRLRVQWDGNELRYDLSTEAATSTQYRYPVSQDSLVQLERRLHAAVTAAHHGALGIDKGLEATGALLAQHLFPPSLVKRLSRLTGETLIISHPPSLLFLPWELLPLHDGPLGETLASSRQMLLEDRSAMPQDPMPIEPNWLIVANPTNDLPQLQCEAEAIMEKLLEKQPGTKMIFLAGTRITRLELLERLEWADLVYYAGHAVHDPEAPSESGWLLADGRLTARDFARLKKVPSLVMANACESGRVAPLKSTGPETEETASLASALLHAGVRHFLGTLWPVSVRAAAIMGHQFMETLVTGEPVGEALRKARQDTREAYPEDPAWAAYCLFGDPSWRLPLHTQYRET